MKKFDQKIQSLSVGKMSATALAVGTGLGFSMSADAAGIVTGNINISLDPWDTTETYNLDINSDGIDDFTFSAFYSPQGYIPGYYGPEYTYEGPYGTYTYGGYYYPGVPIQNFGGSSVSASGNNQVTSNWPLQVGDAIDAARTDFASGSQLGFTDYYQDVGIWREGDIAYLGLQFEANGLTHFGWVKLGIGFEAQLDLFDFAYNEVPFESIDAGEVAVSAVPVPAMAPLFAVATGAMGVLGFRRNKRQDRKEMHEKKLAESA